MMYTDPKGIQSWTRTASPGSQVALPLHPQKSLFDFARAKNIAAGSEAHVNFTISQRLSGGTGPGQLLLHL